MKHTQPPCRTRGYEFHDRTKCAACRKWAVAAYRRLGPFEPKPESAAVTEVRALLRAGPGLYGTPETLLAAVQAMHPDEPDMPYERAIQLVLHLVQDRLVRHADYIGL